MENITRETVIDTIKQVKKEVNQGLGQNQISLVNRLQSDFLDEFEIDNKSFDYDDFMNLCNKDQEKLIEAVGIEEEEGILNEDGYLKETVFYDYESNFLSEAENLWIIDTEFYQAFTINNSWFYDKLEQAGGLIGRFESAEWWLRQSGGCGIDQDRVIQKVMRNLLADWLNISEEELPRLLKKYEIKSEWYFNDYQY